MKWLQKNNFWCTSKIGKPPKKAVFFILVAFKGGCQLQAPRHTYAPSKGRGAQKGLGVFLSLTPLKILLYGLFFQAHFL